MKGLKTGGRKSGTPNKATEEARTLIKSAITGKLTPLEVLLKEMRYNARLVGSMRRKKTLIPKVDPLTGKTPSDTRAKELERESRALLSVATKDMRQLAVDTAPYVHPKMASIDPDTGKVPDTPGPTNIIVAARKIALLLHQASNKLEND